MTTDLDDFLGVSEGPDGPIVVSTRWVDIVAEAQELDRTMSPGPWAVCGANPPMCPCALIWSGPGDMPVAQVYGEDDDAGARWTREQQVINGHGIARLRTLVPALAREVVRLRNEEAARGNRVAFQRTELAQLNEAARRRNLELDALHYVWCDGGCPGGAHRFTDAPVTPEIVAIAIRNTTRLYHWFVSREGHQVPPDLPSRMAAWEEARGKIRTSTIAILEQELDTARAKIAELERERDELRGEK